MERIHWTNHKIYSHDEIIKRMIFVHKNMDDLMPLQGREERILMKYAEKNNLLPYEIICLRNTIKIQKEIDTSKNIAKDTDQIQKEFRKTVEKMEETQDEHIHHQLLKNFFRSLEVPIMAVIKIIQKMDVYKRLDKDSIAYIDKLQKIIYRNQVEITTKSQLFEKSLANFLKENYQTTFRTEKEIQKDPDTTATPDILFDEPVILVLNGKEYQIKWMDAKNYVLVDVPFIIKSLHKQAEKYYNIFGMGAFVFHYGFDSSIIVPHAVILDGSFL